MSIKNMNLVWNLDKTGLTGTHVSILVRLASLGNDDGDSIYPSYNRIALDIGISRQSVIENINQLELKNFISKSSSNNGSTNQYKMNVPLLESTQRGKIRRSQRGLLDKK